MSVMSLSELANSNVPDKEILVSYAENARDYLRTQPWCEEILDLKFGAGIVGVGVFFAQVKLNPRGGDYFWVVVGDLPTLHVYTNEGFITTPAEALFVYAGRLIEWLYAAREGKEFPEMTYSLEEIDRKIGFLMGDVIPYFLGERELDDLSAYADE